jgi:hypothetical protein
MRRAIFFAAVLAASLSLAAGGLPVAHGSPAITVYKSPTCTCCKAWVDQLRAAGFQVVVRDTNDMASVNRSLRIPSRLAACHTAVVGGYLIEGHVPPDLVRQVLADKPQLRGLAVPGMPARAMGDSTGASFNVLSFDDSGHTHVVARR